MCINYILVNLLFCIAMLLTKGCLKRKQICHIELIEMLTDVFSIDYYISSSSIWQSMGIL